MFTSSLLNPRKPLLWLSLAAGAAIFFASGALAARAVIDTGDKDDGTSVASLDRSGIEQPGMGTTGVTSPRFGPGAQPSSIGVNAASPEKVAGRGGAAEASFYYPGCRAPLPASVLNNGVIDPDTVAPGPVHRVQDFPADGARLVADAPSGMRHVRRPFGRRSFTTRSTCGITSPARRISTVSPTRMSRSVT